MRKLMSILMLVVAISVSAQVQVWKAELGNYTLTENWKNGEEVELIKTILITYDKENEKIKVVGSTGTTFYIYEYDRSVKDEGTENEQISAVFKSVDSNGITCIAIASWYTNEDIAFDGLYDIRWRFIYGDAWYGYYCNQLK